MISKGLLPKPLDFDGNLRWKWSEVEDFITKNNNIGEYSDCNEPDEIMTGIENVTSKNHDGSA